MNKQELTDIIQESLRDWFKKEKWVRITTSGNIAGPCGTSKNKKNPDRCLPRAKAQSLSKSERAATARKKKQAGKKGKTVVSNTKKAKVTRESKELATPTLYLNIPKFNQSKTFQQYLIESVKEISLSKENTVDIEGDLTGGIFTVGDVTYEYRIKSIENPYKDSGLFYNIQFTPKGETTSIPKGGKENYIKILSTMYKIIVDFLEKEKPDYFGISSLDNVDDKNYHTVYNRLTDNNLNLIPGYFRKESNLYFDSPQGKGRFIVLKRKPLNKANMKNETSDPQDGKAAPYGSGFKKITREDIKNLVVGTIYEIKNGGPVIEEGKKDDRCTRIAKRKYDTWPSAYASGAVVRCRRGEIWKDVKEETLTGMELHEVYDISAEVEIGDRFYDGTSDQYEVISVDSSHVELKPLTFKGNNTIFPRDLGDGVSIEDFWQHFEKIEDESKGAFGEPHDSNFFGNYIK